MGRIVAPEDPRNVALGDVGGFDPGPLAELERESERWECRMCRRVLAVAIIAAIVLLAVLCSRSHARDDGRFAGSPLKAWFDKLASGKGLCCSFADGVSIEDVDWDSQCTPAIASLSSMECRYRVRLNGQWIDVPDAALVTEPNKFGRAVVWPYQDAAGQTQIRCFIPGAGT